MYCSASSCFSASRSLLDNVLDQEEEPCTSVRSLQDSWRRELGEHDRRCSGAAVDHFEEPQRLLQHLRIIGDLICAHHTYCQTEDDTIETVEGVRDTSWVVSDCLDSFLHVGYEGRQLASKLLVLQEVRQTTTEMIVQVIVLACAVVMRLHFWRLPEEYSIALAEPQVFRLEEQIADPCLLIAQRLYLVRHEKRSCPSSTSLAGS